MLAGATTDGATPLQTEPITDVTLARPSRARWLIGVGAAALVLSAGVVGAKVLQRGPAMPEKVALPGRSSLPAPASQAASLPAPSVTERVAAPEDSVPRPTAEAAVQVARVEFPKEAAPPQVEAPQQASAQQLVASKEAGVPPEEPPKETSALKVVAPPKVSRPRQAKVTVAKAELQKPPPAASAVAKAEGSKPPLEASADPAVCPNTKIDQKTLMTLLKEAEARLQKADPKVCPATTSLIRLREIQKEGSLAVTDEQRMKVAARLGEWEKQFLPKH